MENGINEDQNFYSRTEHQQNYHQAHQTTYDSPTSPPYNYESRSPRVPPKLTYLTTANLQAATANGYGSGLSSGGDPAEFYREYRGAQQSSNGYSDNGMAATLSESRPAPSSSRSNGNGTTPKHPTLPVARNNLKPSYRSASAPINDRSTLGNAKSSPALNGLSQKGKPSVKDLLKRFDQNNEPSSAVPRKPTPRLITKESPTAGPGYMRDRMGFQTRATGNTQTNGTSRAGIVTREGPRSAKSPTDTRSTQRTRFAAEDQHSNNTLSGVPRTTRPRGSVSGNNTQASKSMTNLSPTSPNAPSQVPVRKPLFGEILPSGQAFHGIGGHGMHQATRRISDSNLPAATNLRDKSTLDISPSSPTAWYLGVTPALEDVDPNKGSRASPAHNRNHSDMADKQVNTMNGVNPSNFSSSHTQLYDTKRYVSRSKLPVSARRISDNSDTSSPTSSTRSSSPSASKTFSNGRRKPNQAPWSPAGRTTTPVNRPAASNRITTPPRQSARGKVKSPEKINTNASSLKAYISAPPPKTSPPLRSSRPRQTVTNSSTASSRQKAADRAGSPQQVRSGMNIKRTATEPKARKPIDTTPVDFAAKRELIRRAYTKSIHESEQKEIRAENLRRLQERHAKQAAEKEDNERDEAQAQDRALDEALKALEAGPPSEPEPQPQPSPAKPLQIDTSFFRPEDQDSPTLGMPGSFVDDEEYPASALTDATGTTEFDNEQQTEPPQLTRMSSTERTKSMMSSNIIQWNDLSVDEVSFSMGHLLSSNPSSVVQSTAASPAEERQPERTPTNDIFARDPSPPGAFRDSGDYNAPEFAATLTTASPKQTTPQHSRPGTPLAVSDQPHEHGEVEVIHIHHSPQIEPPQILFHPESDTPESSEESNARSALPAIGTALGMSDVHDFLNTPVTEMDYESSDGYGGANSSEPENYEAQFEPSFDHDQDVRSSARVFRSSHQSSWTNDSIDTAESSGQDDSYRHTTQAASETPYPPPISLSPPKVPPKPENYSPLPSPLFSKEPMRLASPSREPPPLSADAGFGIAFSEPAPVPLWPNYSPPPPPPVPLESDDTPPTRTPPPPSLYNRRPPSSLYQSSHNDTGRTTESRRASDDVYSPRPSISTPRSSTQISLEECTPSQSFDLTDGAPATEEDRKAAEKVKKRLFQRKMLIKELIDTEAVYLKDMNVVEEIYKGTADACPKIDPPDIKTIFRNTDEIVAFSTKFLDELKSAGSSVYSPRMQKKSKGTPATSITLSPSSEDRLSIAATLTEETDEQKDRKTFVGANFSKHLKEMQTIYADFLKNSEHASSRLTTLQADAAVKVWLSECNTVAKDLTAAWDLDALLVKPVQRITRYQLLLAQIFEHTSEDHPDWPDLKVAVEELASLLKNIDDLKKRIQMVGKIVGRKRKESDVRTGLVKAFGRRADKLANANAIRPHDDETYLKLHEKFGDEFLRLQVVLRDVEYYTREVAKYVKNFLEYLSSIELFMRIKASSYPEMESKWIRFNVSMRDIGTVALEDHQNDVRTKVIEPFEAVIKAYNAPSLAMKKRNKRRLDYEKYLSLKGAGKKIDEKLQEMVEQYEALNETLKLELPKLSSLIYEVAHICLIQLIGIQSVWFGIWQEKVKAVLEDNQMPNDVSDIVNMFARDFKYVEVRAQELAIVNGSFLTATPKPRTSQSTPTPISITASTEPKGRPSNLSSRSRGMSINSDQTPSLPTPDFERSHRHSGQFAFSPIGPPTPSFQFAHQTQSYSNGHSRNGSGTPATPDPNAAFASRHHTSSLARPSTGRSHTSETGGAQRPSNDYNTQQRRESGSTSTSHGYHVDGPLQSTRPYSGVFHSAMPLPDGPEDSARSSRASSRDRTTSGGYNILYLAASLFEFNISATKSEAGYPYLTYQAGEIFDVIGEKGELWLAKNQDDPSDQVGWIWSKHFARLATD